MKKYFVISHKLNSNTHLNVQDLLPASCKLITGIAVNATAKQEGQMEDNTELLSFPQNRIEELLANEAITGLFYSYLRTRSDENESRAYFENEMLAQFFTVLSQGITYSCLDISEQTDLSQRIVDIISNDLGDYLYNEIGLFERGNNMSSLGFAELIIEHILKFLFLRREDVFWKTSQTYIRPLPYDCGKISLLVNGNSFLLRDYGVIANRKVKHLRKEIIPFYEPLEVNSNVHTVFKSHKQDNDNALNLRIYIEYEY